MSTSEQEEGDGAMIDKPIDEITAEDLQALVANQVAEGRTLEFKERLPGNSDQERKEFLADVSSFGNAAGGDIVYGVREDGGTAQAVVGLDVSDRDAATQRLENILRDGVSPRIPGYRLRFVDGLPNGPVLVLRVPQSWAGPHMVTFQQHSRFYSRNSAGKYALDVQELRGAFLNSGALSRRIREFQTERLGRIVADETPVRLAGLHRVCVHVIPHSALAVDNNVDLHRVVTDMESLWPLYSSGGHSRRFNLDGLLTWEPIDGGRSSSYLQMFRNGMIETVSCNLFSGDMTDRIPNGLASGAFANDLFRFLDKTLATYRKLEVDPPLSILVTILGAKGAVLHIDQHHTFYGRGRSLPYDRDILILPELILPDATGAASSLVRPILDHLWQAAGMDGCLDYDDQGEWKPRR